MDGEQSSIDRRRSIGYRYLLTEKIGEGAVAEVWKAFDLVEDRPVAVKVLKNVYDPEDAARLQQEVAIVARLRHPNIIRFLDQGVTDRGRRYVVMELLDGRPLRDLLSERKRLALEEAAPIVAQVASALAEAHKARVVHRDVKPENVFLVERARGGPPRVKLLDFGMAKVLGVGRPDITWGGLVFGTPHYMAPERIRGETATAASDVYSLAVMTYEMLVGRRPFEGRTPEEVMTSHLVDNPPPLDDTLDLPESVFQVLERGLSRDPSLRPTAARFGEVFGRIAGEGPS